MFVFLNTTSFWGQAAYTIYKLYRLTDIVSLYFYRMKGNPKVFTLYVKIENDFDREKRNRFVNASTVKQLIVHLVIQVTQVHK